MARFSQLVLRAKRLGDPPGSELRLSRRTVGPVNQPKGVFKIGATTESVQVDGAKLVQFVFRAVGSGYDLVTMVDCLHDMGDPVGAARHVRSTLKPDGTWMIVEPNAGDRVEDDLNPIGRAYYGFSTLLCTPASLSQEVGLALGAQAGEARIREVVETGGFARFRRAVETPFNLVFEVRP